MKIAFNPLGSGALTKAPDNKDITFDLVGRVIYARGVSFDGKNTLYKTFKKHTSSDNTGGSEGLVPIPSYSTTNTRLLREDGLWVNIAGAAPPDTELSTESTNAVQNKVITNKINEILASMQLKAADVYKNIKVGTTTLVASGVNDTLEFKLGNGITITPNATNKTLEFSINATGNLGISTSYSNKQLIVKILDEYYNKWNAVYDWYISVTEEDTDDLINKWQEIVDFLNSVAEGTDILDEFVTRKTAQTITGVKTFNTQLRFTVADGTSPFTVTSKTLVTNLNADLLDGTHKSGLLTALANVNTTDNPLSIYITVGGTTKYLKVSYSQHSTDLVNTSVTNPDSAVSGQYLKWYSQINRSGSDPYYAGTNTGFPVGNNANGILWLGTHSGPYGGLLGVSSNGRLYYRFITNNTFPTTANGGSWNRIAWSSEVDTLKNYYWADVKISSTSSTTTKPTFATATATISVTTPLVSSTGRLTLNATSTALDLKFNNDNTKSVILNGTEFKPYDDANGKLDLGASDARWKGLYAGTGSFSGNVTIAGTMSSANYLLGTALELKTDDTACQTTVFGSNNSGYRMRIVRQATSSNLNTLYSPTLVLSSLDTHAYIAWRYDSDSVWVGGGSGNKWNWRSRLITSANYGSYLGYIGTTAVLKSSAAQALTGITNATLSGRLIFTTAATTASISFINGELIDGYGNVLLGTNSTSWNVFNSSRSSLITALNSGNVGIGTTSPSYKLHVNGTTGIAGSLTLTGTTSSTAILKFSRSGASTWNYIIWPGDTDADCKLAFGYSNTSSACYYYMTNTSFNPVANNARTLGTSSARWSNVYSVLGNFMGNVTLYSSSGDSPHLYFLRGTTTDGTYDWDMFVTGGSLTLRQNNAGTWNTALTAADNYMSTGWRFNVGKELSVKDQRFNYGLAYYTSATPTITGTIVITLPNGWSHSMNTYEIDIYEYNGYNEAADNILHSKLIIDGYNHSGGSYWYNYGYTQIGSYNKGVRLGYNGSKCVIMLGTTSTTWTYPQVHLSRVITGYSNPTTWSTGYSISVITSESGYSSIVTVNRLRQRFADVVANTFRGTLSGRATSVGDGSIIMYPERSNEVNFGGTNNSGAIYFGYRATDSRPIPSNFIFGGSGSATLTATKLHGIGVLTLNGVSGIYLKYNNTDASSIVLSSTYFKPFDVANNKLSLGTNAARWSNVYSYLGNFKDTVHIYADSTGNYTEGIRLYGTAKDSTRSNILFGCDPAATSGTHANQWLFGRDTSNRLVFRNNTTDLMYLTTTGLGIGVVPTLKLHVNGNAIATNFGVNSTAGSGQGISLYNGSGNVATYGIAFVTTGNWGTHGYVTSDWATYFTMSNTNNRGWIFRRNGSGNVFSIDTSGLVYANGRINGNYYTSRVATGTLPYACTSTTLNTNLNADLLDGYHASSFELIKVGTAKPTGTAVGWYRCAQISSSNTGYSLNIIISLQRSYNYPRNEHYIFAISVGYNGLVSINQISGCIGGLRINKVRVVYNNSGKCYFDYYMLTSNYDNGYKVQILAGDCISYLNPVLVSSAGGTAVEFTTVNGIKSNYGFTGNLTGNASSASRLGSSTVGGTYQPIYLSSGTATAGTSYAKAIKTITRSGTTFTYTCIDGTTGTFTLLDNNTVNAGTAGNLAYYSGANAISAYTSTVGDYSTPVYISGGVPISCYAKSVGPVTWGTNCSGYIYVYQFGPITILLGYISRIQTSNTSSTNYVFKLPSGSRSPSTSCGFALVQKDGYSNDRNTVIRLSGQYGYCDANYNDYDPIKNSYYFTAAYM